MLSLFLIRRNCVFKLWRISFAMMVSESTGIPSENKHDRSLREGQRIVTGYLDFLGFL